MIQKRIYFILFILILASSESIAQMPDKEVYMITCAPGSESYSIYGHSAIRLVDNNAGTDKVYNWGVFDFDTPNFNFKFARGRLNYKLGVYSYNKFLEEYYNEKRSVFLQKVNLDKNDIEKLDSLLNENLKEENLYYRYDFLKDNCATRVRDIFEDILQNDLVYYEGDKDYYSTYRKRLDEYQSRMQWLDAGADLLIGSPGDNECGFRESMFLPDYLMWNLADAKVNKGSESYRLMDPVEKVFEFESPAPGTRPGSQPWFILLVISLLLLAITFSLKSRLIQNSIDVILFFILIFLSVLMIFANFFSDHEAMNLNFNLIWLNPFLILAPFYISRRRSSSAFWLLQISLSTLFLVFIIFSKQSINLAFLPLIAILIIRSWYRLKLSRQG